MPRLIECLFFVFSILSKCTQKKQRSQGGRKQALMQPIIDIWRYVYHVTDIRLDVQPNNSKDTCPNTVRS